MIYATHHSNLIEGVSMYHPFIILHHGMMTCTSRSTGLRTCSDPHTITPDPFKSGIHQILSAETCHLLLQGVMKVTWVAGPPVTWFGICLL